MTHINKEESKRPGFMARIEAEIRVMLAEVARGGNIEEVLRKLKTIIYGSYKAGRKGHDTEGREEERAE